MGSCHQINLALKAWSARCVVQIRAVGYSNELVWPAWFWMCVCVWAALCRKSIQGGVVCCRVGARSTAPQLEGAASSLAFRTLASTEFRPPGGSARCFWNRSAIKENRPDLVADPARCTPQDVSETGVLLLKDLAKLQSDLAAAHVATAAAAPAVQGRVPGGSAGGVPAEGLQAEWTNLGHLFDLCARPEVEEQGCSPNASDEDDALPSLGGSELLPRCALL